MLALKYSELIVQKNMIFSSFESEKLVNPFFQDFPNIFYSFSIFAKENSKSLAVVFLRLAYVGLVYG